MAKHMARESSELDLSALATLEPRQLSGATCFRCSQDVGRDVYVQVCTCNLHSLLSNYPYGGLLEAYLLLLLLLVGSESAPEQC